MALAPSAPGPDLSAADLQRVGIGPEDAGRIIMQYVQQQAENDPVALLAALLKSQVSANCRYIVYPFNITGATGIQQVVPENPLRKTLLINIRDTQDTAVAFNRGFLFQPGPLQFTALGALELLQYLRIALNTDATNSFILPGLATTPGIKVFQFRPPPTNPITVVTRSGTRFRGVIVEGI